jgi:hypothetical protein
MNPRQRSGSRCLVLKKSRRTIGWRCSVFEKGFLVLRQVLRAGEARAVPKTDDPNLASVIIDREKEQVLSEHELPDFVWNIRVFFSPCTSPRQSLKRIHGVPHVFQPMLRVLRRLSVNRDGMGHITDRAEGGVRHFD